MDAIISGSARVALLVERDRLWSIDAKAAAGERTPREPQEVRYLLGDARDLTFLEDVEEAAVREELELAHAGADGLHLALMLCDPDTSDEVVALAAVRLDGLLAREAVGERVERILYAKPMPIPFDLGKAAERCRSDGRTRATRFFDALASRQPAIREVRHAWDVLPSALFPSSDDRVFTDGLLAREGLFRSLVRAHETGASLDAWLTAARAATAVTRAHVEQCVEAWAAEVTNQTLETLADQTLAGDPTARRNLQLRLIPWIDLHVNRTLTEHPVVGVGARSPPKMQIEELVEEVLVRILEKDHAVLRKWAQVREQTPLGKYVAHAAHDLVVERSQKPRKRWWPRTLLTRRGERRVPG